MSFCAKFIRKDAPEKAETASLLIKLDVPDKTNWKDVNSVDLGFGIKYELKRLIDSKKALACKFFNLKKEALEVFAM